MGDMQIVPAAACKKVEAQYVEMMVPLYSYGCEKKVKKALSHVRGIYSVNVDYYKQKVTVWGICNKFDVLAIIKTKRKEARFWDSLKDNDSQTSPPQNNTNNTTSNRCNVSKPAFALTRARSLGWKAVKKVFSRSHSF